MSMIRHNATNSKVSFISPGVIDSMPMTYLIRHIVEMGSPNDLRGHAKRAPALMRSSREDSISVYGTEPGQDTACHASVSEDINDELIKLMSRSISTRQLYVMGEITPVGP